MHIQLTPQDANFLREHLARQLKTVEDELVHTDKHELQHALSADARRLRHLIERFAPP